MRPNFVREREASLNLFGNRNENIGRSSERIRAASYFGNRGENIRRPREQIRPNYVRSRRTTKIRQLGDVVLCTMVGAYTLTITHKYKVQ